MSHTTALRRRRETAIKSLGSQGTIGPKRSKQQEEELLHAIGRLRSSLHSWDQSSRATRRLLLERFLWLHSRETQGGAGIGTKMKELTTGTTTTEPNEGTTTTPAANNNEQLLKSESKASISSRSHHHQEQKELTPSPSTASFHFTSNHSVPPISLSNASLESLYGPSASLLLMRITSWLRLTYTLKVANELNLRAIATFCEDAAGGLRFVHEFVEAGGILTLLSIVEAGLPPTNHPGGTPPEHAQHPHQKHDAHHLPQHSPQHQHQPHVRTSSDGAPLSHTDPVHSLTAEAAAAHALEMQKQQAVQEQDEIEKERSLLILLRISLTGRPFKEMICEQRGVAIIIHCLATVAREQTQEVAKQLLCQLGMGNPRYASLVHEELLSVFRGTSSNSCKKMVVQTLYFLLSNLTTNPNEADASLNSSPSMAALHGNFGSGIQYDSHGNPVLEHFTADARYVEATVSLYHINDGQLHYEANQLLKLLITKHQLQEATLQALIKLLKQKTQNQLLSPSATPTSPNASFQDRLNAGMDALSLDPSDPNVDPSEAARRLELQTKLRDRERSSKQSDPKTCAIKVLNELAQMNYEMCLRQTQLGVINLLLDCLCNMNNYELQHAAAGLLYTLNNNVVEAASVIKYMMSGSNESLYIEFLKNPENLHRYLSYQDMKKIQNHLYHGMHPHQLGGLGSPLGGSHTQPSPFVSQRRLERKSFSLQHQQARKDSFTNPNSASSSGISPALTGGPKSSTNPTPASTAKGGSFSFSPSHDHSKPNPTAPSTSSSTIASGGVGGGGGVPSLPTSPSFHTFYPNHSLEDEDAVFFAQGMATIARQSEQDELELQLRHERQVEKERLAAQTRAASLAALLDQEETKQDVVSTLLNSVLKTRRDELSGEENKNDSSEKPTVTDHADGAEAADRSAASKSPVQSKPSTSSGRPADTISVPALQLHFDTKLRLVDEGPPKLHTNLIALKIATGAGSSSNHAQNAPVGGVHEGGTGGPKEKGLDEQGQQDALIYTPFAPPAQPQPPPPNKAFGANGPPAHTKEAKEAAAAAANAEKNSQLIFSQRVGLAHARELKNDPLSEGYLSIHFKDLMHSSRSQFLQHGQPGLMESLASARAGGSVDPDSTPFDDSEYMLPPLLPHVEVLDFQDGVLGMNKKAAAVRQDELRKKRDDKRKQSAMIAANAAASHAEANKYAKSSPSGGGEDEEYSGFTAATIIKQKTADEFSTKKATTLEQEKKAKLKHALGEAAEAAAAIAAAQEEKEKKDKEEGSKKSTSAADILARGTSNRTIIQMAIQLDGTGRTIDPKRWMAHRVSKSVSINAGEEVVKSPKQSAIKKPVLPTRPDETDEDRIEREKIEAELAELRGLTNEESDESDHDHQEREINEDGDHVSSPRNASRPSTSGTSSRPSTQGGKHARKTSVGLPPPTTRRISSIKVRRTPSFGGRSGGDETDSPSSATSNSSGQPTTPRAHSLSILINNVAAGGSAGGGPPSAKNSPRNTMSLTVDVPEPQFGVPPRGKKGEGGSPSPKNGTPTSTRQFLSVLSLDDASGGGGGSASTTRSKTPVPSSPSSRATASDTSSIPQLKRAPSATPSPSTLPVNALGKPMTRRSTVMVPGSGATLKLQESKSLRSSPMIKPMNAPGDTGGRKRGQSVTTAATPSTTLKLPTHTPKSASTQISTMKKLAETDFTEMDL